MEGLGLMSLRNCDRQFRIRLDFARRSARVLCGVLVAVLLGTVAGAQSSPYVLERKGRTISLEPYAANILRVTMSGDKAAAGGDPGYGFVAKPSGEGWTHEHDAEGDVFRSAKMVVRLGPGDLP